MLNVDGFASMPTVSPCVSVRCINAGDAWVYAHDVHVHLSRQSDMVQEAQFVLGSALTSVGCSPTYSGLRRLRLARFGEVEMALDRMPMAPEHLVVFSIVPGNGYDTGLHANSRAHRLLRACTIVMSQLSVKSGYNQF
jgi:hypothetical protein